MRPDGLAFAGRHAKWVLAAGLAAGVALPGLARFLADFLVPLIIAIMFLGTMRLHPRAAQLVYQRPGLAVGQILLIQLLCPLLAAFGFWSAGLMGTPVATGVIVVLSGPAIVSSPNIAAILGLDDALAMRIAIWGTCLVPLTALPALLILFGSADALAVGHAALRLAAIIAIAGGLGHLLRRVMLPDLSTTGLQRLDGLSALTLGVFVIALMPALRSTFDANPVELMGWIALAFGVNFGSQWAVFRFFRTRTDHACAGGFALTAGNRNFALFFAALAPEHTAPMLPFLAAYQLPMFLTPLALGWMYRR
ncbi:MAG: hypothetical protein HRU30_05430 [Rhodobacteraceae bacterium]|nr:hypothetical protein [Paracoccaceae bacterium]